jgi:hypothetical protein
VTTALRRSRQAALDQLAEVDARADAPAWLSLAPGRTHARSLHAIGGAVLEPALERREAWGPIPSCQRPAALEAYADGLVAIALAMRDAFPHNVFGDLDHLAASLWHDALVAPEGPVSFLRRECGRVVALQHLFGRQTPIRFRYAHDFLYGFDWAKWVAADPGARAHVRPFSPLFLETMRARGHELLVVIAAGRDRRYPPLPDGRPRNAFGFSREPGDELALHRRLARAGLLPVEAWRTAAIPRWDRPFAQLRREHAAHLGLLHEAAGAASHRAG